MSYPFHQTDAGRRLSKRPKQKHDCTVRALSIALRIPYDKAYDILARAGRECNKGFDLVTWLNIQPFATKIPFPAIKGEPRMNPVQFCKRYSKGVYICRVAKHVFAVVDGTVYDSYKERNDRCIYTAWRIDTCK